MKICQSISSISRLAAGVSGFLLPLSQNLNTMDVSIEILSFHDRYSSSDLRLWQHLTPILLNNRLSSFGYSEDFVEALNNINPSLIHQHGLWMFPSLAVLRWTTKHQIPRIVSPHGMLEPWAWKHKNWKKSQSGIYGKKLITKQPLRSMLHQSRK